MDLKADINISYPFPIAVTFHNADNAREPVEAHDKTLKLFEVVLKYFASVAIGEYLEDGPTDPQVNRTLAGLVRPSLGQWNGFLREILTYYHRSGLIDKLLIPSLHPLYFEKAKDRPAMCAAFTAMRNFIEDRRDSGGVSSLAVRDFFDRLIQYRNKTAGHGALTTEHCAAFTEPIFEALQEMLGLFSVLKEHRLVYIEEVRLVRGKYTHELTSYMGPLRTRLKTAYVATDQSKYRVEDRLYLCPRGDDTPSLCLHPLMIALSQDILFLNESARDREIEYLSYQTGQIKRPDRLLEDFQQILGGVIDSNAEAPATASPLEDGRRAVDAGDWVRAQELLNRVPADDPRAPEAQQLLLRARQALAINERQGQVRTFAAQRRWDDALAAADALQQDLAALPELHVTLLADVARLRTVEDLYQQAMSAYGAQRWDRAGDLMRQVRALEPEYRDAAGTAMRLERLGQVYDQAVAALGQREWVAALTLLRQLEALQKDYKDVAGLLVRAQKGMEEEGELAEQYERARSAMAMEDWQDAYDRLQALQRLRAGHKDVAERLATVREKLTVRCWKCGAAVPPERRFCGTCGASRDRPVPVAPPPLKPAEPAPVSPAQSAAAPAASAPDSKPVVPPAQPTVITPAPLPVAPVRVEPPVAVQPAVPVQVEPPPPEAPPVTPAPAEPAPPAEPLVAPVLMHTVPDPEAELGRQYETAQAHIAALRYEDAVTVLEGLERVRPGYRDVPLLLRQTREKLPHFCWRCGKPMAATRRFCGACGAPRERPPSQPLPPAGPARTASKVVCPVCRYENAPGKKFCGNCGQPLTGRV